ncbi:XrtA-associated tyrosine autokinase [Azohydromonas aeria]|uniref:XrtA-associated tyrosine autokinase n=1 Tax=Azohydromonas aeria TaxID=2590212 RepID=UPI0012F784EA|nr:XrtA-associated tyrosine autokinase [Azohydromonas aeria]
MTSLIEQAAARLAQLRNAGAVSSPPAGPEADAPAGSPAATAAPGAAVAVAAARPAAPTELPAVVRAAELPQPAPAAAPQPVTPRPVPMTSRRVELDLQRLAAANFVTPGAPRSRIADQYRVIKRPLIANALGKGAAPVAHGNRIMVTSALPGEGKTFTAVNLALSIAAEMDTTVMLVDADVGRPSVLRTLGLAPGPGLLDVLEGRATMPEVLLRTNVDKLVLLPSGTLHDRTTELLASDGMHQLLQEVAQRYEDRIIIFDSPPLLLTTEARALATHMGQVIIVVQAGHTSQSDVQAALATIESCPVKLMLLNKARMSKLDAYTSGYGYGYGYGYGAGQGQQPV